MRIAGMHLSIHFFLLLFLFQAFSAGCLAEDLARLQRKELTRTLPVVVISADAMPHQVDSLLSAGARNYLTKPLNLTSLPKIIDEYIIG